MQGATLEELRELSRRSRRAQATGFLGLAVALLMIPLALALPSWGAYVALLGGGAALVAYAFMVGEERGAFRRVFRRINEDRSALRRAEIDGVAPIASPSS